MKMSSNSTIVPDQEALVEMVLSNMGFSNDHIFFRREAVAMLATSGSISALSSIIIISIIFRSRSKLTSPYHCIILFMSSCDIATSIAIAFGTVPMPADVQTVYPFETNAYGTAGTCTAQGLTILLGQTCTMFSNVVLCIYHACTLKYGMRPETAKKRLLPIALFILIILCLVAAYPSLSLDLINPRPFEPYCYLGSYPETCNYAKQNMLPFDIDCISKDIPFSSELRWKVVYLSIVGACFTIILISLLVVITSITRTGRLVAKEKREQQQEESQEESQEEPEFIDHSQSEVPNVNVTQAEEVRTILYLAMMYILAYLFTWTWTYLSVVMGPILNHELKSVQIFWHVVDHMKLICSPLQGFFNALIFIYDKMYYVRKADRNLTFFAALKKVIITPSQIPDVMVLSLDLLQDDERRREDILIEQKVQADFAQESTISPASIPSNFISIDTPSLELSNAISGQGIDSEKEKEMTRDGDPSENRQYYDISTMDTMPDDLRAWITGVSPTRTRADMNGNISSEESTSVGNISYASSQPSKESGMSLGSGVSISAISNAGSTRSKRSIFSFGSLLSGFTGELGTIDESPKENQMTSKEELDVNMNVDGHENA